MVHTTARRWPLTCWSDGKWSGACILCRDRCPLKDVMNTGAGSPTRSVLGRHGDVGTKIRNPGRTRRLRFLSFGRLRTSILLMCVPTSPRPLVYPTYPRWHIFTPLSVVTARENGEVLLTTLVTASGMKLTYEKEKQQ